MGLDLKFDLLPNLESDLAFDLLLYLFADQDDNTLRRPFGIADDVRSYRICSAICTYKVFVGQ